MSSGAGPATGVAPGACTPPRVFAGVGPAALRRAPLAGELPRVDPAGPAAPREPLVVTPAESPPAVVRPLVELPAREFESAAAARAAARRASAAVPKVGNANVGMSSRVTTCDGAFVPWVDEMIGRKYSPPMPTRHASTNGIATRRLS